MINETKTTEGFLMLDLWRKFELVELTEIMRQEGDANFIELLHNIRVGNVDRYADDILKTRFVQQPTNCTHMIHCIFMQKMIQQTDIMSLCLILSKGEKYLYWLKMNCRMSDVLQAQNRRQSDTGGLAMPLKVKVNERVMVIPNIGLSGRLKNGQIGTAKYYVINQNEMETIYVASDDILAWQKGINGNNIAAGSNKWVSIKREETSIYINKFKITSPAIRQS